MSALNRSHIKLAIKPSPLKTNKAADCQEKVAVVNIRCHHKEPSIIKTQVVNYQERVIATKSRC